MSYDGEKEEASQHFVQRMSPKVKPKRMLPSTTKRILPKPDWNFNSQSFRTTNSRIEDSPMRIKKSQSFAGNFCFSHIQCGGYGEGAKFKIETTSSSP